MLCFLSLIFFIRFSAFILFINFIFFFDTIFAFLYFLFAFRILSFFSAGVYCFCTATISGCFSGKFKPFVRCLAFYVLLFLLFLKMVLSFMVEFGYSILSKSIMSWCSALFLAEFIFFRSIADQLSYVHPYATFQGIPSIPTGWILAFSTLCIEGAIPFIVVILIYRISHLSY